MLKRYSNFMNRVLLTTRVKGNSELDYLRDALFVAFLKVLLPLAFFAGIIGVVGAIVDGVYYVVIMANILYISLVWVMVSKHISIAFKKHFFLVNMYMLSVALTFSMGTSGPGMYWLFGMSIIVTGLINVKYGYVSIVMNMVIITIYFILNRYNVITFLGYEQHSKSYWIILLINFLLLSVILVFAVGKIINGLDFNIKRLHKVHSDLSDRESILRTIYHTIDEAVITVNAYNRIQAMNYKAEQLTGYKKEASYNKLLSKVYHVQRKQHSVTVGDKELMRSVLTSKSGKRYEIEESVTQVESEEVLYSRIIVFRDLTVHNKIENELRQSYKMQAVGQLAGGIAHDFNNMLAGILGYAELIELGTKEQPKLNRYSKAIIDTSNKAAALTSRLLDFSRSDVVSFKELDVNDVIIKGLRLLKRTIDRNIKIRTELTASQLKIQGDESQLENIILNLGINARDAMPEGGSFIVVSQFIVLDEVYCSISKFEITPGEYAKITFSDEGMGIDAFVVERIFEPFYTTKEVGEGTGLGLSAVYGTVVAHGGAIEVDSTVGVGTQFSVYLPLFDR